MNEFCILWTLVVSYFAPTYPVTERFVTETLSYHATESLCDQALKKEAKARRLKYRHAVILTCDPPERIREYNNVIN